MRTVLATLSLSPRQLLDPLVRLDRQVLRAALVLPDLRDRRALLEVLVRPDPPALKEPLVAQDLPGLLAPLDRKERPGPTLRYLAPLDPLGLLDRQAERDLPVLLVRRDLPVLPVRPATVEASRTPSAPRRLTLILVTVPMVALLKRNAP